MPAAERGALFQVTFRHRTKSGGLLDETIQPPLIAAITSTRDAGASGVSSAARSRST